MNQRNVLLAVFSIGTLVSGLAAIGQTAAPKNDGAKAEVESFWETSKILDMAVKNLARRYNLTERQTEFTREMLTTRVNGFLESHRDEVWPLLRDLVMHQRNGEAPDAETAKRLGPRALRIIEEAKQEIYSSNTEWREILTDEQKLLHDWDLRQMDGTFEGMEKNFEAWAKGEPISGSIFPQAKRRLEPRRPTKPDKDSLYHPKPQEDPERDAIFDIYVKKFIADFELKPDQVESARSILREIKLRASDFRETNRKQIDIVNKKMNEGKVAQRKIWNAKRKQLFKPVNDLFAELKGRLDQIPDEAQRERQLLKGKQATARKRAVSSSKKTARPSPKPVPVGSNGGGAEAEKPE